jgi:hypothetical protein
MSFGIPVRNGLGLGLLASTSLATRNSGGGSAPFTPALLFASGEQGVWYDPSDFSTLFQDSAGTIPVTAVEQPVGRMLDLSKGLVLGSELVTNGDFASNVTGWTSNVGVTLSWDTGRAKLTSGGGGGSSLAVSSGFATVIGQTYRVQMNFAKGTVTSDTALIGISNNADGSAAYFQTATSGYPGGTLTAYFTATATTTYAYGRWNTTNSSETWFLDNVSVKSIAGNHATQATSAARPTLSARVNLLTKTEQFDDAAWSKTNATAVATSATNDPLGGTTAEVFTANVGTGSVTDIFQNATLAAITPYKAIIYVKKNTHDFVQIRHYTAVGGATRYANFNVASGVLGTVGVDATAAITDAGNGWWRCQLTATVTGTAGGFDFYLIPNATAASAPSWTRLGTESVYIWGADLRVANDTALPAYQRVNTATDYNATGFPTYLLFDGTDDSMATASIDFTATDKMSVFAGVRKLSDAASGVVASLGTFVSGNTFELQAPSSIAPTSNYNWATHGNGVNVAAADFNVYRQDGVAAPITNVLTGTADRSIQNTNGVSLRNNGVIATRTATTSTGANVSGTFADAALSVGRRSGAAGVFLNGRIYSLIVRGATTSETQIGQTEQWISNEMGGGYYPTGFDFLVTADGDQLTDASGNPLFITAYYS